MSPDATAPDVAPAELLRIATAGSVDDGKSTLIGRLLYDSKAIFEDQLEAVELLFLAEVRGEADHLTAIVLSQPGHDHGRIETSGIGQHALFHLTHGLGSSFGRRSSIMAISSQFGYFGQFRQSPQILCGSLSWATTSKPIL